MLGFSLVFYNLHVGKPGLDSRERERESREREREREREGGGLDIKLLSRLNS